MNENQTERIAAAPDMKMFYACFIVFVTGAFGFILWAITLPQWGQEFNLTQTQPGQISGVGFWPFAISIILFSLIIDKMVVSTKEEKHLQQVH